MVDDGSGIRKNPAAVAVLASTVFDVLVGVGVASAFGLDHGEWPFYFALATYGLVPVTLIGGIFMMLIPQRGLRQTGKAIIIGGVLAAVLGMVAMLAGKALQLVAGMIVPSVRPPRWYAVVALSWRLDSANVSIA